MPVTPAMPVMPAMQETPVTLTSVFRNASDTCDASAFLKQQFPAVPRDL